MKTCLGPASISGDKGCSHLPGVRKCRGHLKGEFMPRFEVDGGQRAFPVSAFSQVLSVQNNHYTEVVFFLKLESAPLS